MAKKKDNKFYGTGRRKSSIARVYLEKEPNNINERLSALEEGQSKSEEKQSVTDGAIEELATLMSEVVSND